jgi:hypothetical protein
MKSKLARAQIFKLYAFSILGVLSLLLTLFSISIIAAKSGSRVPVYEELDHIVSQVDTISLANVESIGPMGLFKLQSDSSSYRVSGMAYSVLDTTAFSLLKAGDTLSVKYRIPQTKRGMMFKELVYWLQFRDVWEIKHNGQTLLNYNLVKTRTDFFNQKFLKVMWPMLFVFAISAILFGFLTFRILRSR